MAAPLAAAPAPATPVIIPGGRLPQALAALAAQTGVDIASLEPGLAAVRVPPVAGTMTAAEALRRLLAGSGFRAVPADTAGYRIVPDAPAALPGAMLVDAEQVVIAAKLPRPLLSYPGSVTLALPPFAEAGAARASSDELAEHLPVLQTTAFGEGRNKLFVRGIADSGFSGSTPAVTSVYFGDAQLGFLSPTPSLRLVDIRAHEVLEGPQGTLYGAGALGGVVRITPNPVALRAAQAMVAGGLSAIAGGSTGADGSAMVNLPLVAGRLGLRMVGYGASEPGWLRGGDGARPSNRVVIAGGRLALRWQPDPDWDVDASALVQSTRARDAQYVEPGETPRRRRLDLAEPFGNDIALGRLVLQRQFDDGLALLSSTALVARTSTDDFSTRAATLARPTIYRIARDSRLFSQEVRLTRDLADDRQLLVGAAYTRSRDAVVRALGLADDPAALDEVTNTTHVASLFGQANWPLAEALSLTAGLRASYARTDSEAAVRRRDQPSLRGEPSRRLDPTLALTWRLAAETVAFARLQTGFRTGGLAVERNVGRTAVFAPDEMLMQEVGLRHLPRDPGRPTLTLALAHADWRRIQADLIDPRGRPFTANIGNARILTVEAALRWEAVPGLTVGTATLATASRFRGMARPDGSGAGQRLAQVPPLSTVASLGWRRHRWRVDGELRYVGRSQLGPTGSFAIDQGGYAIADVHAAAPLGATEVQLSVTNVGNARANRFSFGNPLSFALRPQETPLRPRAIRVGLQWHW